MELRSKENKSFVITVNSKRNKILLTKGFVTIIKGAHYGANTDHPDILEEKYALPKDTIIG